MRNGMKVNLIGKQYKIVKEDAELKLQFPVFAVGFEFEVIRVCDIPGGEIGITGVRSIESGQDYFISDKISLELDEDGESWFWCFYNMLDAENEEEIEELTERKQIVSQKIQLNHFQGKPVDIAAALFAFAAQEGCDGEEYDLMQAAGEYIRQLEARV